MTGLFSTWPYPLAVSMLFLIALARGNLTYWLGRAAQAGARRTRARRLIESPGFGRASRLLNRWGPPVVSVSFLTVGFQTLINLAAGVSRMPLRRYLPAVGVGALLWAFLYATVGFVAFAAWFQLYERSPVLAIVALAVVVVGLLIFVLSQLRSRRSAVSEGDHRVDSTTGS
ncbi:DedA family protein [Microlunatus soli]|uniref:Membrane protein DedA, SNARE-associated domain n=1 Tax=Microlunatus soli TaxID=630515 RepID=A0A1H1TBG1_9ACTN|nr:VTT domain-containing protein [Microlunatus soli]SDS56939.1 membrane protein DedA, SNARE-associated domain [Microlunatus soli]